MRKVRLNWLTAAIVGMLAAGGMTLSSPGVSGASSDYSPAVYQVTFSLNCNGPTAPCQNFVGLGGLWGWYALTGSSTGGNASAQVTGCGHVLRGPGAFAGHEAYDTPWTVIVPGTTPYLTGESVDPSNPLLAPQDPTGTYLEIGPSPDGNFPPLIVPATTGHYAISWDGAKGEITVAP